MLRLLALVLGLMLFSAPSSAQNLAYLRYDCAAGVTPCFTDVTSLSDWLFLGGRVPAPSYVDPVTVLIENNGPLGHIFHGNISCDVDLGGTGHVTFRGVGPTPTIKGTDVPFYDFTIYSDGCDELAFENLNIEEPTNATLGLGIAAYWKGSGDSRWINVQLTSNYIAWYDSVCDGPTSSPPVGVHYVQGSTITGRAIAWYADCGEALFYDTQISVTPEPSTSLPGGGPGIGQYIAGVQANYLADLYLLDSTVTVDATPRSSAIKAIGVQVGISQNGEPSGSGEVEMFGGALTVKGSANHTLYGGHTKKYSETTAPAAVRIQGTQLTLQNGTAPVNVVAGDGELERVDLEP